MAWPHMKRTTTMLTPLDERGALICGVAGPVRRQAWERITS